MNILRYAAVTLLLGSFPWTLNANIPDEEMVVIDSELAEYNGEKILLQGNVVVEHMLGTVSANHIVLHTSKKKEARPFTLLQMQDHVLLVFKDGETLSCGKAELDYQTLTGNFSGDACQEFVTYTENNVNKREDDAAATPFVVKSRHMSVCLTSTKVGDKETPKNNIDSLTADEQVSVNYNNDFIGAADHAVYQRTVKAIESAKTTALPGTVTMTAAQVDGTCQVSNREGDIIKANQISIDTIARRLTFTHPKGTLKGCDIAKNSGSIDFSAETLVWDDLLGVLVLSKKVEVNQGGIGKLVTPQEVRIYQHVIDQKKQLKAVETFADTVLTYREEDKNLSHTLTCSGPVKVDHEKMETRLLAHCNDSEGVAEDQQVHFEDAKGEIFADKVLVKYTVLDGSIVISKILLQGNVKIYNRLSSADDETVVVLQCALADRVDFKPHTNEMLFKSSDRRRRVLFFDKTNNLQVSAPALKIIRDKASKKESIKGVGDVRFSFIESEFDQLRKRFLNVLEISKEKKTLGNS